MGKDIIFWNWFIENSSKYFSINQLTDLEEKERLLEEFLKQLHDYCDKLYFEIGGVPNERQELIITSAGNRDYFVKVEALVGRAPKLNDWEIIAFKPAMGTNFVTQYLGVELDPKKIWFLPLDNEKFPLALGLRIFLPIYTIEQQDILLEGCYQLLNTMLGEKSAALDVQHVEIDKIPNNPEENGLIEFSELVEYISWRKRKV